MNSSVEACTVRRLRTDKHDLKYHHATFAGINEFTLFISQLPKLCVKIRISMHRIFNFYFVGALF